MPRPVDYERTDTYAGQSRNMLKPRVLNSLYRRLIIGRDKDMALSFFRLPEDP